METARERSIGSKQRERIEFLLHEIEAVWNRSDAEAYASLYDPEAVYVSRGGAVWEGRDEIRRNHAAAFGGPLRHTILTFRAWRIRMLSPRIAIVHAAVEIAHPWNSGQVVQALTTFVCTSAHDRWLIASAHTTDLV